MMTESKSLLTLDESDDLDEEENQDHSFSSYEKVRFFIDDNGIIQLIHLTDHIFTKDVAHLQDML